MRVAIAGGLHNSGGGKILSSQRETLRRQGEPQKGQSSPGSKLRSLLHLPFAESLFRWQKLMPQGLYLVCAFDVPHEYQEDAGQRWTTFARHGRHRQQWNCRLEGLVHPVLSTLQRALPAEVRSASVLDRRSRYTSRTSLRCRTLTRSILDLHPLWQCTFLHVAASPS